MSTAIPLSASSLIALLLKNLPAMQEPWVQFLGQKDPLEKEMATHSSIVAWKLPWMEEPGVATVHSTAKSPQTQLSDLTFTFFSTAQKCHPQRRSTS